MKINFTNSLCDKLYDQLLSAISSFSYDYSYSNIASLNIKFPPFTPVFLTSISNGHIPNQDELFSMFINRQDIDTPTGVSKSDFIKARIQNFYASFLRELHVILYIKKHYSYCEVIKTDDLDMADGCDFILKIHDKIIKIAIKHIGSKSDFFNIVRKDKKENNVDFLFSKNDFYTKIHLVSIDDIKNLINKYGVNL